VKTLDSFLLRNDPTYTQSNRLFIDIWSSNDTTKIKTMLSSSSYIRVLVKNINQYIISNHKVISHTSYVFFDAIRWKYKTNISKNVNFFTDKDILKLIGD